MNILVACEVSGRVRNAFRRRGHAAYSCDILSNHSPYHIQGNALDYLNDGWNMLIAFPPCTYLTAAGNRAGHRGSEKEREALDFVRQLMNAPIPYIAIENPAGSIGTHIRKADQFIHPYQFGEPYYKKTGLWLKNLPELITTQIAKPPYYRWHDMKTPHIRSLTFKGIADAMSRQWGRPL